MAKSTGLTKIKYEPSPELADVLGSGRPVTRPDVMKKIWVYIKRKDCQDGRDILCGEDELLTALLGPHTITMFEMNKKLSKHLKRIN